jgi:hypothetical protein
MEAHAFNYHQDSLVYVHLYGQERFVQYVIIFFANLRIFQESTRASQSFLLILRRR